MFEDNVLERGGGALEDAETLPSAPASLREPATSSWNEQSRAEARPSGKPTGSPSLPGAEQTQATDAPRGRGLLRRRPVVSAIGALLLRAVPWRGLSLC